MFQPDPYGSAFGSNKVKTLCFWKGSRRLFQINGSDKINKLDEIPIKRQLKPAKNKIYKPAIKITKLVPRSGCILIRFTMKKINNNVKKVFFKLIGRGLSNTYAARKTGSVTLIISEVCGVKNPKSSHRLAPLISLPVSKVSKTKKIEIRIT